MSQSDFERLMRAMRRTAAIWGVIIGLLLASLTLQIVRLVSHSGFVAVVCQKYDQKCVAINR